MDPSLMMSGANAAGDLIAAIYNAATLPARKREWLKKQRAQAREDYILSPKWYDTGFFPKGMVQAAAKDRAIRRAADQQFQLDPMS